jgi:hypothetical protein
MTTGFQSPLDEKGGHVSVDLSQAGTCERMLMYAGAARTVRHR